jgi:hypothetical protein
MLVINSESNAEHKNTLCGKLQSVIMLQKVRNICIGGRERSYFSAFYSLGVYSRVLAAGYKIVSQ